MARGDFYMINFKEEVEKRKSQLIKDIETLCAIPSVYDDKTIAVNQPYGESCRKALDAMLEMGKRDGFAVYDDNGYAGHIDIGEGERAFGILGHLDVVPVNPQGWNSDPFHVVQQDGKLYGRGVADDKGPLLAGYYAAKIIHDLKLPVSKKIRVIFGCDEERGSSCVKHYFTNNPFPDMGFTPDAEFPVVYGEKGMIGFKISGHKEKNGLIAMIAGERANIVPEECVAIVEGSPKKYEESFKTFLANHKVTGTLEEEGNCTKLILKGKGAHASLPEEGINSVALMSQYLKTIVNNDFVTFIVNHLNDYYGKGLGIDFEGEMGKLTMNLGILKYVKEEGSISLDLRCPHEVNLEQIANDVEELCAKAGFNCESSITQPLYVDPNSELIQKLHKAYVEVSGDNSEPQAIGGGTYAKSMPNCVAFGCEFKDEDNAIHGNNENIKIESLLKSTEIFAKAIYDLIKE